MIFSFTETPDFSVRELSDEEIAAYHAEGVVHLPRLVGPDQASTLLTAADQRPSNPGPHASEMASDGRFFEERNIWPHDPFFRSFVFDLLNWRSR